MPKRLVDTSVWSLALRRPSPELNPVVPYLINLLRDANIVIIGPIRQELLSGIRSQEQFDRIKSRLSIYPDTSIWSQDYITAAEYSNLCRRHGVQGSHTDFLICAVSVRNSWPILTTDIDFSHYARYIPIELDSATTSPSTLDPVQLIREDRDR